MFRAPEPFRKEVVEDEPSKDMATVVSKFLSCHKKYQHREPLKGLGIPGMTVEEFWEDGDKDRNEFEYGKPLVTKQVHAKFMWPVRRLHKWYYLACVCGLQFIKGHIHEEVFKSRSFDLNIEMFELHNIYRLRMLDITMMTIMCTLVHVADDEKRLGYMNPTQINQLELNPVINEKSDKFKGMSKKKIGHNNKKSTTKSDQREKRSCINPQRSTISVV
jgi:hypothetical protein